MTDKELQEEWLKHNKPTIVREHEEVFEPADTIVPLPKVGLDHPYLKYQRLDKVVYSASGYDENVRNYGD